MKCRSVPDGTLGDKLLRRALVNAAVVAASVTLSIGGMELLLRWLGEDLTPPTPMTSYIARPWGSVMAPQAAPGMVNSFGTFDVEHSLTKPAGTYRIVTLGDSFLGLPTLPHADLAPQTLERILNTRGSCSRGGRCEVLNFSVSSAGTANEYLRYLADARRFAPDLVVVFFTVSNDMRNNSVALQPLVEAAPIPLPGFALAPDGTLKRVIIPPAPGSYIHYEGPVRQWLVGHSALYRRASRAWQILMGARSVVLEQAQWEITASFLQQPAPPAVTDAWQVTGALIGALDSAVADDGGQLIVVVVPTAWDVDPRWKAWLFDRLPPSVRRDTLDFDLPYREAQRRIAEHGVPVLDLRASFRREFDATRAALYDDTGHWTRRGHALAARETASFIERELWGRGARASRESSSLR